MDNRGFMMAEVIVVSAIVLTLLATLYYSFNRLYSLYITRLSYYDVVSIYRLDYYRRALIEDDKMNAKLASAKSSINKAVAIDKIYAEDKVFLINNNKTKLSQATINWVNANTDIHQTYKDYFNYLATSDELETNKSNYVLVIERCHNTDNCKYAYLEVYDGYE